MNTLTFVLDTNKLESPFDGKPYLGIEATPLVDGQVVSHMAFDALAALQGAASNYADYLLTCSCGIPGCGNVAAPVVVHCDEHTVSWQFALPEYNSHLTKEARAMLAHGRFVFDRHQYLQALENLKVEIIALANAADMPAGMVPGAYPQAHISLESQIEDACAVAEVLRDQEEWFDKALQELSAASLVLRLPSGRLVYVVAAQIAEAIEAAMGSSEEVCNVLNAYRDQGVSTREGLLMALQMHIVDKDDIKEFLYRAGAGTQDVADWPPEEIRVQHY